MVTHIVLFKLSDPSAENLAVTHAKLLSMQGKIAQLRHLEAGIDVIRSERSYDIAPPGGESLKDTAARVLPFYSKSITPEIKSGKSVIVVGHGNSLRALVMQLDRLSPEQVKELSIGTGMPLIYRLRADGSVAAMEIADLDGDGRRRPRGRRHLV